jgi:K+-transporting ATPase KdpF subunit
MTAVQILAALLTLGLLVYLCIALLMPERFQ